MKDRTLPDRIRELPVAQQFPLIQQHLDGEKKRFVIQADPGAGKSTGIPLFLLSSGHVKNKILMLEPRRMAARSLASYLAGLLGESPGQSVGYRVRGESRCSSRTRLEILTEGVFVRMIQEDPELEGVDCVILDEFHERNLFSDLSYAFLIDVMENLRPELICCIMSATPEREKLEKKFRDAVFLNAPGRMFPVDIQYSRTAGSFRIEESAVERAVRTGLDQTEGDLLVFLPGEGEIKRVETYLHNSLDPQAVTLLPLYGRLPLSRQELVFKPSDKRKIILATSIAETSLTIPGVTAVIDSGLERHSDFNRHTGLTRLATRRISQASAEQRAGRAGRVREGLCLRLWSEQEQPALVPFREAEIFTSDLSSLVLEILSWGCQGPEDLEWMDPPPGGHYHQALNLLKMLQAVDSEGKITALGRRMSSLGLEPRLSRLVLTGQDRGEEETACFLAALLSERDWMGHSGSSDLLARFHRIRNGEDRHHPVVKRILSLWKSLLGRNPIGENLNPRSVQALLLASYPDRMGGRIRPGTFHLSGGGNASIRDTDSLQSEEFLVVLETGGSGVPPVIFLSCPVRSEEILDQCRDILSDEEEYHWNEKSGRLESRSLVKLGELRLKEKPLSGGSDEKVLAYLKGYFSKRGLSLLDWSREDSIFLNRCRYIRQSGWPDFSDQGLLDSLDTWFIPYLNRGKITLPLKEGLKSLLSWEQMTLLDTLVPERFQVPSGSRLRIDYSDPENPALDVRIQEVFGLGETPLIGGTAPLLIRLLNPAGRPIQVTRDLKSFWDNTYSEVRKELRGRYPKHYWPENPYEAVATSRVRPKKN